MSMKFIGRAKSIHLSDSCYNYLNLLVCFGYSEAVWAVRAKDAMTKPKPNTLWTIPAVGNNPSHGLLRAGKTFGEFVTSTYDD